MNFPPKAISVLLLVQCLFIGMGYALARKMVRVMEQVGDLNSIRYLPDCASFVLKLGLWAFLIPLLWAAWASLRSESHQAIPMTRAVDTKITLALTVLTICIWSYGAMQAMSMAFGIPEHMHVAAQIRRQR